MASLAMSHRMELQRLSEQLSEEEVSSLRFLCRDELPTWASQPTAELLMSIYQKGGIGQLRAKLSALHRHDLLSRLSTYNAQMAAGDDSVRYGTVATSRTGSSFREFLVELNEEISNDELSSIKYCLQDDLPQNRLQNVNSLLELCHLLEEQGQLSSDNLSMLEQCFEIAERHDLKKKLNRFKLKSPAGSKRTADPATYMRMPSAERVYVNAHPASLPDRLMHSGAHNRQMNGCGRGVQMVEKSYNSGSSSVRGIAGPLMSQYPNACPHTSMRQPIPVHSSVVQASRDRPNATSSSILETDSYPMAQPLGVCLLVVNKQGLRNTDALYKDAENIRKAFSNLGFEVKIVHDLSGMDMRNLQSLCPFKKMHSCFVCFVLGKGTDSDINGTDGIPVSIEMLSMNFNGQHCPALVGKPKLFFILTVMVAGTFYGQSLQVDSSGGLHYDDYLETDGPGIPINADVLECKHVVEEDACSRKDKFEGTPFIKHLTICLSELWPMGHDLLEVLTEVNRRVSNCNQGLQQRPPKLSNTLRKRLILPQTQGSLKQI